MTSCIFAEAAAPCGKMKPNVSIWVRHKPDGVHRVTAVANAGISGSDVRDMMLETVEKRFGATLRMLSSISLTTVQPTQLGTQGCCPRAWLRKRERTSKDPQMQRARPTSRPRYRVCAPVHCNVSITAPASRTDIGKPRHVPIRFASTE